MDARELALAMLLEAVEEKSPSHTVLARNLGRNDKMDKRERAFATALFEGTLERLLTLDFMISCCSKVPIKKMKPVIRQILRMGFYQLSYMHVPPSAVCNEAVKLAKKRGLSGLSGFVNGVLRAAVRNPIDIEKETGGLSLKERLSVLYSMPEWLVERFIQWYGTARAKEMFQAFLEVPPLTVRVNRSKCSVKECTELLEAEKIKVSPGIFADMALRLNGVDSVERMEACQKGLVQVQDEASMLPVLWAGIEEKTFDGRCYIIDCCAAPGGKTLMAADELLRHGQAGLVSARDISAYKLEKIQENITRTGFTNIETLLWDACQVREQDNRAADIVLADLPCSGLGIIAKKPDIKYNITPEGISELVTLQKNMLRAAAQYVKPGGVLIYSTCTINPEENLENALWVQEELGLIKEAPKNFPEISGSLSEKDFGVQLLPEVGGTDGFFVSRFRRPAD